MTTQEIVELRAIAKGIEQLQMRATGKVSAYYQGSQDILLKVAVMHELRCPLAVALFQQPVKVREVL